MRVCLMVEGQEGVAWGDWVALAEACEAHGFEGLFRSDHYLSLSDPERGSLDAWATLAALAARTGDLRLGTLVSPVTFRAASVLAKNVVTVDHVSGGRVEVGLGAGWMEAEHARFGFGFPPLGERMAMLETQLEAVRRHFETEHPRPVQPGGPPIIMGGQARPRSAALAARHADEYNTVGATVEECRERRRSIADACRAAGRDPIGFSLMTGFVIGADAAAVAERAEQIAEWTGAGRLPSAWPSGTPGQVVEQLRAFERAGVERVFLQHHLHTDLEAIELLGREVIPALA